MRSSSKLPLLFLAALLAVVVAVGCGGDSDDSGSAAAPAAASTPASAPAEAGAAKDAAKSASQADSAETGGKKAASPAAEDAAGTAEKGLTQAEMQKKLRENKRAVAKARRIVRAKGKRIHNEIAADQEERLAEYREALKTITIGPSMLPDAVKKACKSELASAPASGAELAEAVDRAVTQLTKLTAKGSPALNNVSGDIVALRQATAVLRAMRAVEGPARSGDSAELRAALGALAGTARSNRLKTCAIG
jgi:hypothetical protein